jgi:transposase
MNRLLSNWAFFQLRQFIDYKAGRNGVVVVTISPEYTSKMCSRCHEISSIRPGNVGFFKCLNCGYSCNADLNASFNIRGRVDAVRNTFGLFVNQPIVAGGYHPGGKPTASAVGS